MAAPPPIAPPGWPPDVLKGECAPGDSPPPPSRSRGRLADDMRRVEAAGQAASSRNAGAVGFAAMTAAVARGRLGARSVRTQPPAFATHLRDAVALEPVAFDEDMDPPHGRRVGHAPAVSARRSGGKSASKVARSFGRKTCGAWFDGFGHRAQGWPAMS